ncbi:MAG: cell division protein FtsW (lipid II flippase), partial [Limisphaerales bacterium]
MNPLEHTKTNKRIPIDWSVMGAVLCLMVLGFMFIYSARFTTEGEERALLTRFAGRQVIWYVIGTAGMITMCLIDYRVMS